jgi:OOP family OmpA-OmpF porin
MKNNINASMKKGAISLAVLLFTITCNAQIAYNYLKAADNYFSKGDYYSAAQYYEKFIGNKSKKGKGYDPYVVDKAKKPTTASTSRAAVVYKAAESYRLLRNFVKAEPYYKEVAEMSDQFPYAKYWYAKSLRSNSKFDEAETTLTDFVSKYTAKDSISEDATKELASLRFIQSQLKRSDLNLFTVNKYTGDGQKHGADYAPALQNASTVIFTSTRIDSSDASKSHINRLYTVQSNTLATAATKLSIPQTKGMHQGVGSVTPDGNKLYLTKWSSEAGKKSASIYWSKNEGGSWSDPALVSGDINVDGYNSQQPYVTEDGKYLFYASDKPGGEGKYDIWVASIQADGSASSSVNIGRTINTKDDEQAPFYYKGKKLVFSTNGRVGMGGYDFFQAEGSMNNWSEPANMGNPINSVKDDIYMVSNGQRDVMDNMYLSSDRNSECCLELYNVSKLRLKKKVTGTVVDCNTGAPIAGSAIKIAGSDNGVIANKTTDEKGQFELVLDDFQPLTITAEKEGFIAKTQQVTDVPAETVPSMNTPAICLAVPVVEKPFKENVPVVLNNIFFEFNKYVLTPSSYPSLDELVKSLEGNPTMVIEVSAHTDALGDDDYNMKLSALRAKSVVEYLISKGIDPARLESKGYGETMPVAPNKKPNGKDDPEGRAKNRRVEFKVLHY